MTDVPWSQQLIDASRGRVEASVGPGVREITETVDLRGVTLWAVAQFGILARSSDQEVAVAVLRLSGAELGKPMPPMAELATQTVHMSLDGLAYLITGIESTMIKIGEGWPERWEAEKARQRILRAARQAGAEGQG